MKKLTYSLLSKISTLALIAAVSSVGTASYFGLHQPKIPDELKK